MSDIEQFSTIVLQYRDVVLLAPPWSDDSSGDGVAAAAAVVVVSVPYMDVCSGNDGDGGIEGETGCIICV